MSADKSYLPEAVVATIGALGFGFWMHSFGACVFVWPLLMSIYEIAGKLSKWLDPR